MANSFLEREKGMKKMDSTLLFSRFRKPENFRQLLAKEEEELRGVFPKYQNIVGCRSIMLGAQSKSPFHRRNDPTNKKISTKDFLPAPNIYFPTPSIFLKNQKYPYVPMWSRTYNLRVISTTL